MCKTQVPGVNFPVPWEKIGKCYGFSCSVCLIPAPETNVKGKKRIRWVVKEKVAGEFGGTVEGNFPQGSAYLPAVACALWSRLCQSLSRQGAGSQKDLQGSHCHSDTAASPHQLELETRDSQAIQWPLLAPLHPAHVAVGHYWQRALGEALHLGRGWVLPHPAHPGARHLEVRIG